MPLVRLVIALAVMCLAVGARAQTTAGPTQAELNGADTDPASWLTFNKGYLGYRYSPLSAITPATAPQVGVICRADLSVQGNFETGPLVYNGVLYATVGLTTYAIDAATCARLWTYTYPAPKGGGVTNRGLAIAGGRLFRGLSNGHLIAIDAATGVLLWDVVAMDVGLGEIITGSPLAWNSLVFTGKAGGDKGIQGAVFAFDTATGARRWTFNTVPNPGEFGSASWPDATAISHGGGATWTAFSLDLARGLLLVPVGNPGPDENKSVRKGRNLFTASIVALKAGTGALSWFHQLLRADDRDWDTTIVAGMPTASGVDIAVGAGKDGVLHIVDRANGKLLHTVPLVQRYLNTTTRVPKGNGIRICPVQAVQWNGPSYSPVTNLLYIGGIDWCTQAIQGPVPVWQPNQSYTGWANGAGGTKDPVGSAVGYLNGIDAGSGALVWRATTAALPLGGVVATAGGVVAAALLNGDVAFYDAATGDLAASLNVGQPIGGGLISYLAGGRQRLAVAAGLTSRDYQTSGTATVVILGLP